jgi:hypothetical protein
VANVFVLGQRFDFATFSSDDRMPTRDTADEMGRAVTLQSIADSRVTVGMIGSGYIEMLARQMTADLQSIRGGIAPGGSMTLVSKGIPSERVMGHVKGGRSLDHPAVPPGGPGCVAPEIHEHTLRCGCRRATLYSAASVFFCGAGKHSLVARDLAWNCVGSAFRSNGMATTPLRGSYTKSDCEELAIERFGWAARFRRPSVVRLY